MYSVTRRIGVVRQPYGGYINKKQFDVVQFNDGIKLNDKENVQPTLVGLVVDYMTRFMVGESVGSVFMISLLGARILDSVMGDCYAVKNANKLLNNIVGLDRESITSACKLVGYDVVKRAGISGYRSVDEVNPNKDTIDNIKVMVERSISFWEEYGPIVKYGFTFEGGYTDIISSGDGDYLTKDTLWDFKVLKNEPTYKHTLQILVYYIMGINSIHTEFSGIKKLGIYNPRLNKVYTVDIDKIDKSIIDGVAKDVIGYAV